MFSGVFGPGEVIPSVQLGNIELSTGTRGGCISCVWALSWGSTLTHVDAADGLGQRSPVRAMFSGCSNESQTAGENTKQLSDLS